MSTMTCPVCGTQSEAGKKFCAECGVALPLLCPACGHPVTATQKFCDECGGSLHGAGLAGQALTPQPPSATAPSPVSSRAVPAAPRQEERRLVTVLFCDLVGFTPLSEQLDPEEVRDIQAAYFSAMSEQIERYGGMVEKYAGDAVLALFGAPIAHEDDAERAVLCALGMQAAMEPVAMNVRTRWNVQLSVRLGVNTGEVVSGTWNASGRQDVAVTGDAINTAARLQAAADLGEVLAGAETVRLTRRRIRYGPRRELVLKGKQATVPVYPALGIWEDVVERWEDAPRASPFMGRDRELTLLLDAWMRAKDGEGQLVTLVGEPGVGKSRLVAETLEKIGRDGTAAQIIRARCLSYGQEVSLWLLGDLLRSLFGIREQSGHEEIRHKLGSAITVLLAASDEATRAEALDVVGEVMGLSRSESLVAQAEPQIRRRAFLRSLRLLLGALSGSTPAVIVLEDLHWIDQASHEVLQEGLSDIPGLRLLVIATHRPGWSPPWSGWGWIERLTLRPLRETDAALLAGAVLGGMQLSPELQHHLAERAAGNPFFVEQMLQALEDSGGLVNQDGTVSLAPGAAERLPSSLTEVLLARLDRLEAHVRTVAQVGSVIGRSFAVRLLAQVMEREQAALELPLVALQEAEIAFPRRGPDLEYVFKHVTMREVAYNTLVVRRRQELHLQTARAIATLYPVDEYVELIAYHYSRTEAHAEAVSWLERAGDRAAAVYATDSALGHYRETIRRLRALEADLLSIARVEEKLGHALAACGRYDDALDVLGRAVETNRAERDLEAAGRVTAQMAVLHRIRGTPEEGIAFTQPMLQLLAANGPSPALASLHLALATLYIAVGRNGNARAAAERAEEIARVIGDDQLRAQADERRAVALVDQPEEALQLFERAIPILEVGGDIFDHWRALHNAAVLYSGLGRMEESRQYAERALAVVGRRDNPDQTAYVLGNLGSVLITLGDWDEAHRHLERALALMGEERQATAVSLLGNVGLLALYQGDWEQAERVLDEALEVCYLTGERQSLVDSQVSLAELELLSGRPMNAVDRLGGLVAEDTSLSAFPVLAWAYLEAGAVERAEAVITEGIRRARATKQSLYLPDGLRVEGMVRTRQERLDEAEAAFAEGLELARSFPYAYAEGRILYQWGLLEQQRREPERAQQRLEQAQTIFRRLGASKDVERTEQALAASGWSTDPAR